MRFPAVTFVASATLFAILHAGSCSDRVGAAKITRAATGMMTRATRRASGTRHHSAQAPSHYSGELTSSTAVYQASPAASARTSTSAVPTASPQSANSLPRYWTGANSYYLHTFPKADRIAILDALRSAGMSTVRIFLAYVYAGNKGSSNIAMNDLEPVGLGVYDDTILEAVDQLMVECKARGIKLVVAMHDRYALGFWSTDVYATKYGIVRSGSSGAQMVSDASTFYTSDAAMTNFDARLRHIMRHKNNLTGLTWAQSGDYIYAVEPQNEPQGHMTMAYVNWNCDRASTLRSELPPHSSILVSTGGGITTTTSLADWAFACPYFDIISVHDYGTDAATTAAALVAAQKRTDKIVMMGEWGMTGSSKASRTAAFVRAFAKNQLPWMYWQVSKPGAGASDFEVWTDDAAWTALAGAAAGGINPLSTYNGSVSSSAAATAAAAAATTAAGGINPLPIHNASVSSAAAAAATATATADAGGIAPLPIQNASIPSAAAVAAAGIITPLPLQNASVPSAAAADALSGALSDVLPDVLSVGTAAAGAGLGAGDGRRRASRSALAGDRGQISFFVPAPNVAVPVAVPAEVRPAPPPRGRRRHHPRSPRYGRRAPVGRFVKRGITRRHLRS